MNSRFALIPHSSTHRDLLGRQPSWRNYRRVLQEGVPIAHKPSNRSQAGVVPNPLVGTQHAPHSTSAMRVEAVHKLQSAIANVTPAGVIAEPDRKLAEPGSGQPAND